MREREIVLEFYDELLKSVKDGKSYSRLELCNISEGIVETKLKPRYGRFLISHYRIKEQIPFMLGG